MRILLISRRRCLNEEKRLLERSLLQEIGRYPGIVFETVID